MGYEPATEINWIEFLKFVAAQNTWHAVCIMPIL